jgi:hypothetical protein
MPIAICQLILRLPTTMQFSEYFTGVQQGTRFDQQAYQFVLLLITSDGLVSLAHFRQSEEQHARTLVPRMSFVGHPG